MTHDNGDGEREPSPYLGREPSNADIMRTLSAWDKKLDRIDHFITGGKDPSRGAIVRMDRLEQRGKLTWAAIIGAVMALLAVGWEALKGSPTPPAGHP